MTPLTSPTPAPPRGPGGPAAAGDRRGRPGRGGVVHGDLPLQPGSPAGDAGHGSWVIAAARKAASGGTAKERFQKGVWNLVFRVPDTFLKPFLTFRPPVGDASFIVITPPRSMSL